MTTIQIRIDEKMKKDAMKLFESLGTDISGATKMFISQSLRTKTLAIKGLTENGFTPEQEEEIFEAYEDSKKPGGRSEPMTPEEFSIYLKSKIGKK